MTDTSTILFRISEDGEDYTYGDMRSANPEDADLLAWLDHALVGDAYDDMHSIRVERVQ